MNRYRNYQFIMNLAIHVTLEAIEDIQRRKQPAARQEIKGENKMRKENTQNHEEKQETYIVCISPDWVRDTQVFDVDSLPEDLDTNTLDIHDEAYEPLWYDAREPLFVCTIQAHDEEEACRIADEKHGKHPIKCLYAFCP